MTGRAVMPWRSTRPTSLKWKTIFIVMYISADGAYYVYSIEQYYMVYASNNYPSSNTLFIKL